MANGFKVDNATGAPGVQPWSRGEIYPLVIARVERYQDFVGSYKPGTISDSLERAFFFAAPLEARLSSVSYDVLNADDDMSGFASYDDALAAAKGWLAAQVEEPTYAYEAMMVDGEWIAIDAFQVNDYVSVGFPVRRWEV